MTKHYKLLCAGMLAGVLGVSAAQAQEDSSAAFEADKAAMGAALGLAAPESTITTHDNGMSSAVVGLSHMKMLMLRQDADGSVSFGHAGSEAEAESFLDSTNSQRPAEK